MFEESVEGFMLQWKNYAAQVHLFAHVEGSPLLECEALGKVFHVFERTAPYAATLGKAQVIIHPVTEKVYQSTQQKKAFDVVGLSKIQARGVVLYRQWNIVVIDAGIPLVVGVFSPLLEEVTAGDWLEFSAQAPLHGFVLPEVRQQSSRSFENSEQDSL